MTGIKQALLILIVTVIVALGVNLVHPDSIPYIGDWRELSSGDGPIVPPEAGEGDPPFIALDKAHVEFVAGNTVFVDARDPSEFECGTIPGSINIPFDYLPYDGLDQYFDSTLAGVAKDDPIVVFCSGEECDLSLHLARNLQDFGYTNLMIFFGGSREWEENGLKMERRVDCGS